MTAWAKRTTLPSPRRSATVSFSPNTPCSGSTRSAYQALSRPSTILGTACSGLPSLRVSSSNDSRAVSTSSVSISSRLSASGLANAMCSAISCAVSGVGAAHLDEHAVDAPAVLHVHVGVEHVPGGGLEAGHGADLDVLPLGDPQRVEVLGQTAQRAPRHRRARHPPCAGPGPRSPRPWPRSRSRT